jgi:hypothetical protein
MSTLDDAATRALFNELDTDKSGFIELGELTAFFKKHGKVVSEMEIGKAMGKADTNNDDKLSFEEFKVVFEKNRNELPFGLQTVVDLGKAFFETKPPPIFSPKPGKYYIVNVNSGMFMYVCDGNGMDNGDRLAQWENMSYASQWELTCLGADKYSIKHVRSGKFINVAYSSKDNGAQLQLYDNPQCPETNWWFHADARYMLGEKTVYNISNVHSGKFINVSGGRKDNGALLIQWDNPKSSHTQWYLKKVPE